MHPRTHRKAMRDHHKTRRLFASLKNQSFHDCPSMPQKLLDHLQSLKTCAVEAVPMSSRPKFLYFQESNDLKDILLLRRVENIIGQANKDDGADRIIVSVYMDSTVMWQSLIIVAAAYEQLAPQMVGRPESEKVKAQKKREKKSACLEQAYNLWKSQTDLPESQRLSRRKIAAKFHVDKATLSRRIEGKQTIQQFNTTKQKLSPAQENALADWILRSAERGQPPTHAQIKTYANAILQKDKGPDYSEVGPTWIYHFLKRHHEISMHWSKALDMQRAQSLNPAAVDHWFELVKEQIVEAGVKPENTYGMDESSTPRGNVTKERVAGARGTKTQHRTGGANRENITSVVTICADGTTLNPTVIFKGQNLYTKWSENNVANATKRFSVSEKGWTDSDIMCKWIKTEFNPKTQAKAAGAKRVLLMDGHSSHFTPEVIEFALARNIVILGYPPHCTHALQGLDVVCFAKMKNEMKNSIAKFEDENKCEVGKADFAFVFGRAFNIAFTASTVKMAFEKTGIFPFNPGATSIKGSFAVTASSPVKAIMKSYRTYQPTSFEASPTHALPPQLVPSSPLVPLSPQPNASTSRQRLRSLEPDETPSKRMRMMTSQPTLFDTSSMHAGPTQPVASSSRLPIALPRPQPDETPSTRMRIMASEMASTSSGSFLVSKSPYTSSTPFPRMLEKQPLTIPAPDWGLLVKPPVYRTRQELEEENRKLVQSLANAKGYIAAFSDREETLSAQMVVQDMTLVKLNAALHAKEVKKGRKNDNEVLPNDGMGRLWSDVRILEYQKKKKADKEQELAEKEVRKQQRSSKKALKGLINAEWEAIKEKHSEDIEKWNTTCVGLKEKGVKAKDLPKKPSRETKKSLVARLSGNDSEESEEETDED
ncbi:hypothetical protein D9757_009862 [Collybiopsis confluens]|uniref:HTH CENPB-type domain-containing protein n=1 Tax=Collybiopsis confluens TaxID=2823264 RepID=A0A8H5H765_9AGAR|nr:hypothetical protein D9757_009862 [Collybiopsis confluens]